jgi:hypothetical protein
LTLTFMLSYHFHAEIVELLVSYHCNFICMISFSLGGGT